MKFRAIMVDSGPMREFTNIVTTVSKLSKECVMRLSSDHIYFILSEFSYDAVPMLWCIIPQKSYFSDYEMIGVDDEHNEIYLSFNTVNLAKSFTTARQSVASVKIKLTKKHRPCLTMDFEVVSQISMETRHIIYDTPVSIIPRKSWSDYKEPGDPDVDICVELPALKKLRQTVDRMRNMANDLIIGANPSGVLTLQIKTDTVKVSTRFQHIQVEQFNGPINEDDEFDQMENQTTDITCRVDSKKFFTFLNADLITHERTLCAIKHKKLVTLSLETAEDVRFQFYIPGICF